MAKDCWTVNCLVKEVFRLPLRDDERLPAATAAAAAVGGVAMQDPPEESRIGEESVRQVTWPVGLLPILIEDEIDEEGLCGVVGHLDTTGQRDLVDPGLRTFLATVSELNSNL